MEMKKDPKQSNRDWENEIRVEEKMKNTLKGTDRQMS